MKTILVLIFLLTSILTSSCGTQLVQAENYRNKKVTIGFIPGTDIVKLRKSSVALALLLQKKLGIPVDVYISKNYAGLVDAMARKKIDFAFFSALTFVFAEKKSGAKVLLKKIWKDPFYYSSIITLKKDKSINKISELKGKKIAFVDKNSASGYLLPSQAIIKQGYKLNKLFSNIIFTGNHDKSVAMLLAGEVDAAAVFANDKEGNEGAWSRNVRKNEFKKIWLSGPMPTDPFCVRNDFYLSNPRLTHDLMFALIELDKSSEGKGTLRNLLNISRLELATKGQYEPVRKLVEELKLKLEE